MSKSGLPLTLWDFEAWDVLDAGSVVVACSGGADSTALACAVADFISDPLNAEYWEQTPPRLVLWHLDHQLREDSARDAQFVQELGAKLGATVIIKREDIRELASQRKQNIEAMARERRYAMLEALCGSPAGSDGIALPAYAFTAHHQHDQAETILMRLLRGAHSKGLQGILPWYGEYIYRPWLQVQRAQILEYLAELGQDYMLDATNSDTRRTRNLIRHEILPLLEQISVKAVERIARLADIAARAEAFSGILIASRQIIRHDQDALTQCLPLAAKPWGRYSAHIAGHPWPEFDALADYVTAELEREGLRPDSRQLDQLEALSWCMPQPVYLHGWSVRLGSPVALLLAGPLAPRAPEPALQLSQSRWVSNGVVELRLEKVSGADKRPSPAVYDPFAISTQRTWPRMMASLFLGPPESAEWKCWLPDALRLPLAVRPWRAGDRIKLAHEGSKKLSDVFIDAKVPPAFRHVWLVLVDATDEVLWVPGLADSAWMALAPGAPPAWQVRIVAKPPFDAELTDRRAQLFAGAEGSAAVWDLEDYD